MEKNTDPTEDFKWVIQNGDVTVVKEHFKNGVNVNEFVQNSLHIAADFGHHEMLKLLIEKGADVNAEDKHGMTPLLAAIYENHVECVKVLVENGASRNGKTLQGQSYSEIASAEVKKLLAEESA
ncbi:myotrophin-like [Ylistrum balloti]|uniref:myotrophin-like n=1 Tax=Ylistrum balloti TaxID=509963 RepID=UPI002905B379|nr:myotrophin-like [Ylistrum balloti]